jgi:ubiquinone/menaquinone biosynthesis C-methylase UbiE
MTSAVGRFDRLARPYRLLERLAFGRALERARFQYLDRLAGARDVLVVGEGDGRCLQRVLRVAPDARIHCVEASARMLAIARARLSRAGEARVTWTHADVFDVDLPTSSYDAVVTHFVLDCFSSAQTEALIRRLSAAMRPAACWLWADFHLPLSGLARWHAQAWLALLYGFFRWQTGIEARILPAAEAMIEGEDFRCVSAREFRAGLIRGAEYRRGDALRQETSL